MKTHTNLFRFMDSAVRPWGVITFLFALTGCGGQSSLDSSFSSSSNGGGGAYAGSSAAGGLIANLGGAHTTTGGVSMTVGGAAGTIIGGSSARGTTATGNVPPTGGNSTIGGGMATGGTTAAGTSTGGAMAAGTPKVADNGYLSVAAGTVALMGYVSSFEGGSGSSITLTYNSTSFCASGTVGANTSYACYAGAGFNVNQAESGASGSSSSLALNGTTISISYVNNAGSTLEFQVYDGSNWWCFYLPPSTSPTTKTIPLSSLNTACWDNSGSSFTSGASITTVNLVAPGSASSATPFNFCFLGLTVQ